MGAREDGADRHGNKEGQNVLKHAQTHKQRKVPPPLRRPLKRTHFKTRFAPLRIRWRDSQATQTCSSWGDRHRTEVGEEGWGGRRRHS